MLLHALFTSADDVASTGQNPVEQIASILQDAKAKSGMASAPASEDIGRALSQALGGAMRNVEGSNLRFSVRRCFPRIHADHTKFELSRAHPAAVGS